MKPAPPVTRIRFVMFFSSRSALGTSRWCAEARPPGRPWVPTRTPFAPFGCPGSGPLGLPAGAACGRCRRGGRRAFSRPPRGRSTTPPRGLPKSPAPSPPPPAGGGQSLRRGREKVPSPFRFGHAERLVRAEGVGFQRLDAELRVVDGARRGREVEDEIDLAGNPHLFRNVLPDEREVRMLLERREVVAGAGEEVVDGDHFVVLGQETLA